MKVSAQEEFGLRCLIAIASADPVSGLTIPQLSRIEGMTQPHVAKMLSILRKAGYIKSTRGQVGGYTLAQDPRKMVVGEIMALLGGRLFGEDYCDKHAATLDECAHGPECQLRPLWVRIQSAVDSVVYRITVQDLIDNRLETPENVTFHATAPEVR